MQEKILLRPHNSPDGGGGGSGSGEPVAKGRIGDRFETKKVASIKNLIKNFMLTFLTQMHNIKTKVLSNF